MRMKKMSKIIGTLLCAGSCTFLALGCGSSESTGSTVENEPQVVNEDPVESADNTVETPDIVDDDTTSLLGESFNDAIMAIGMDISGVKNLEKLDDWASGERYSFIYDGFRYIVYVLDNGEINSICNDNLSVKIYERGYQPLDYKDFEPDLSITDGLQDIAIQALGKYVLNEDTLRTRLGFTSFYRIYDYYTYTGEVVAKNEVDKETFAFSVDLLVDGSTATVMYVAIDGIIQYGSQDAMPVIDKVPLSNEEDGAASDSGTSIIISDGKLGDYGKEDLFDGDPYIRYYLPAGQYNIKCIIRGGFYIESIEIFKEDGWDTVTTFDQVMMESGEEKIITIEEGQCISLIINTELECTPIN